MSLRFIIGRAGTGKTHTCLEEITKELLQEPEGRDIILLVPEQATFQMEKALTQTPGLEGVMRVQILSFRRLAWRVFGETGGAAKVAIGDLGKRMALRNIIRKHPGNLQVFAKSAGRFGFIDSLARALGEIKTYQITPQGLEAAAQNLDASQTLLKGKLGDLNLLYNELETFMAGKFSDTDDHLSLLAESLLEAPSLKGTEIWVDGFTGFTPQENSVLQNLLKVASKVNLSLCLDSSCLAEELAEEELFYPLWSTYKQLCHLADEAGIPVEEPILLKGLGRFEKAKDLAHLEANFYCYPAKKYPEKPQSLQLACAANRRAEVEAVARELIRLCRERGYRWHDTALILRDLAPYGELIKTVFHDYGIPFFIDHKRTEMHHPLVELVRSALEVVIKDWAYEPVFRCLKTDLIPITRDEVDRLENYVLAHGINGGRWTDGKDWNYRRHYTLGEDEEVSAEEIDELAVINEIRQKASTSLKKFAAKARKTANVLELTTALYLFLEDLNAYETLMAWGEDALAEGNLESGREHQQIWGSLTNLFEEIVEALGEEQLTPEEYLEVLDAGLESLKLGLIPPGLDQVLVGSLERSRNPNIRAAFVLGVNDGVLPARPVSEGLFSDTERETLEGSGLQLAPNSRRKVFDEQFLVYTALTRSSEYLWVSYPMADEEGKALTPSSVISRFKALFPELEEKVCHLEPQEGCDGDPNFAANRHSALVYLAARLREAKAGRQISTLWWDVYNWFNSSSDKREQARGVLSGIFHVNQEQKLAPTVSRRLFGFPLKTSVSRIERYKACPFAHYAGYGLKLKERPAYKLAAPDMGEFLHASLKGFADKLVQEGLDWGSLNREQCGEISSQVVDVLAPQLQSEILLSSARYRYITGKLKRVVTQAASTLAEHARRSSFRPVGLELAFGPGGDLPPLSIPLTEGEIELKGRIDRVDLAKIGDKYYLRVIDYKSSDNQLRLPEVYNGLKLQLLTYLHVVLTHAKALTGEECLPGGVLYFTVKEPVVSNSGPMDEEKVSKEILKELKMNGLLLSDPEVIRRMDSQVDGWSELFRLGLNKDGNFYKNSQVVSEAQFDSLRKYLEKTFMEAGEAILDGKVAIEPFRDKKSSACTFCKFKPVCKFDLQLADNLYKLLKEPDEEDIWAEIEGKEEGHERTEMD